MLLYLVEPESSRILCCKVFKRGINNIAAVSDIPAFRLDYELPTTLKHRTCNTQLPTSFGPLAIQCQVNVIVFHASALFPLKCTLRMSKLESYHHYLYQYPCYHQPASLGSFLQLLLRPGHRTETLNLLQAPCCSFQGGVNVKS